MPSPPPEADQKSEVRLRCLNYTAAPPCSSHSYQSCSRSLTPENENEIKICNIEEDKNHTDNDSMWTPGSRREPLRQPLRRR